MKNKIELNETLGGIPAQTAKEIQNTNPPDIGAYGGRVTEGDDDGHSICLKDADTSDSRSVSGRHRTD